jgi:CRISPR-associated protein Csb2
VTVHADAALAPADLTALAAIERLWISEQGEWSLLFEGAGVRADFQGHPYLRPSRTWTSVTPYLHPWYAKASFTVEDQIRKELALRGLPEPELRRLGAVPVGAHERRPAHFHRFRRRRGLTQPDTAGSFWELTFPETVPGPLALGFSCHYGLGLFAGEGGPSRDA